MMKLQVLALPTKIHNALMRAGIVTVEDLAAMSDHEVLAVRGISKNGLAIIQICLAGVGRSLTKRCKHCGQVITTQI